MAEQTGSIVISGTAPIDYSLGLITSSSLSGDPTERSGMCSRELQRPLLCCSMKVICGRGYDGEDHVAPPSCLLLASSHLALRLASRSCWSAPRANPRVMLTLAYSYPTQRATSLDDLDLKMGPKLIELDLDLDTGRFGSETG